MKILHVTREAAGDARYGIGKSLAPLIEAQRRRGHVAWWFDQSRAAEFPPGRGWVGLCRALFRIAARWYGESSVPILGMVRERVFVAHAAARFARQHAVDVVHCHDPLLVWALRHFLSVRDLPVRIGYTAHGFGRFVQERPGVAIPRRLLQRLQAWESDVAVSSDFVLAPSVAGLERMADDLGLPVRPERWFHVTHPRPEMALTERRAARVALGLPIDVNIILAVGQLIPMKRFRLLIDACARVRELPASVLIVILGEGDAHGLRDAASRAGIGERLRIAVTDDIAAWLSAADIYVSTSATESYGMANMEAMHAGLPVLAAAVGAVPEVAGAGAWLLGRAAEQGSEQDDRLVDDLAGALTTLLTDIEARERLACKGRERVRNWPDADQVASEVDAAYNSGLN